MTRIEAAGIINAIKCSMVTTPKEHEALTMAECVLFKAEPVKHGRWILCTKTGMPLTEYGRCQGEKWFGYKCSECNAIYKGNALMESPYCQRCGAKMDEVEP